MAQPGTCEHAPASMGGKGASEDLTMGGRVLHPHDYILRALGVSCTSEDWAIYFHKGLHGEFQVT